MEEHITDKIKKLREFEKNVDAQRKELNEVNEEILKIKKNLELIKEKYNRQHEEIICNSKKIISLKLQVDVCKNRETSLQQILTKYKQENSNSELKLETKQNKVWKERESFCETVNDFLIKYGLPTTYNIVNDIWEKSNCIKKIQEEEDFSKMNNENEEILEMTRQSAALENILKNLNQENEYYIKERQKLIKEKERLLVEQTEGEEFNRLREALRYSHEQTEKLKREWDDLLDDNINDESINSNNFSQSQISTDKLKRNWKEIIEEHEDQNLNSSATRESGQKKSKQVRFNEHIIYFKENINNNSVN